VQCMTDIAQSSSGHAQTITTDASLTVIQVKTVH
jgi:hypothetical protein